MTMMSLETHKSAALLLLGMFLLMMLSSLGDSPTMDERAHIPSGYSYVAKLDYRLNPEHPPLAKALSGLFLLPLNLNFPENTKAWAEDINGQWDQGVAFLYEAGNDPDQILFWSRLPMMILTIITGAFFYWITQRHFGKKTALAALLFFVFSPTFLAHGKLVTTDIGATLGFLIGIASFVFFLQSPRAPNILIAGVAFGVALLLKYSTFLLIPVYGALLLAWVAALPNLSLSARAKTAGRLMLKSALIGLVGVALVSLVYAVFVWNYPIERQLSDSRTILESYGNTSLVRLQETMIQNPLTRPFAHYLLGLMMVIQRADGGNTAYFFGYVTNLGSRLYFPLTYLTKEPIVLHLSSLLALYVGGKRIAAKYPWSRERLLYWVHQNFFLFASGFFVIFYWAYSMRSPLNIGVRHVLPTFPFIYLLVSRQITYWMNAVPFAMPGTLAETFQYLKEKFLAPVPRYIAVSFLFGWLILETLFVFPHFLSYYNELAGGSANGYRVAVDSNYDWGQDLKRLQKYVEKNRIPKIALDYFGGGVPSHYLGNKFEPWWSARGKPDGYFAVSASFRETATHPTKDGFVIKPEDSYAWLADHEPIDRVGYSIWIYKFD